MEFRLAPGWKIYWRSPNDTGLPPKIELKSIEGKVLTTLINWPVPKRFNSFGFDNFGYDNEVILQFLSVVIKLPLQPKFLA